MITFKGGATLALMDAFKRMVPRKKDFDSNENHRTATYRDNDNRNQSENKMRRDKT